MLCIEISRPHSKPFLLSAWYRAPNSPVEVLDSLDNFLQKCDTEEKELVVIGDINCDFIKPQPDLHTRRLLFLCSLYQLDQLINEATRVSEASATLIDVILTNNKESFSNSGVIHLGISDHSLIYAIKKFTLPKRNQIFKEVRNYKRFNESDFIEDLSKMPWHEIQKYTNPNECWSMWKSLFEQTLDKHAPLIHKRIRDSSVPWITPEIKKLMKTRDYHKKKAVKTRSNVHWTNFRRLRNKVNIELRKSKSNYFREKINDCTKTTDPKKSWSIINTLLGKSNRPSNINNLLIDGNTSESNPKEIAEAFNDYFVNIGPKLASEIDQGTAFHINTNHNLENYFEFTPILIESVEKSLRTLKNSKSTGLDKLPAKMLKIAANTIAPSLAYIFNLSLTTGIYIDDWKNARVTPIFKSENRRLCENYRPISILPIVSKVFEREVFKQVYTFLTDNNLLSKFQSGFRPKHSTLTALIQMCDQWMHDMDDGKLTGVLFLDIKKAFDSINHEILLQKMKHYYGIKDIQLEWFQSYLTNRKQQCLVNNCLSSSKTIVCGIPQGSILGPLLFLLYINDLPDCLKSTTPCMYADDTQFSSASHDIDELITNLNSDLTNVRKWLNTNKLQMHPSKTKLMFIGSQHNINNLNKEPLKISQIAINNKPVTRTVEQKCLGVLIDEKLNWEKHIEMICKKASMGISAMRRIKPYVSRNTLDAAYKALVQPHFEYCSPLWDNCGKMLKDKLQRFQSRAARILLGAGYDMRSADVLDALGWKTLNEKRNYAKAILMFKVIHGYTAPELELNFIRRSIKQNTYKLRNCATDLSLPTPKREFLKKSFKYSGASLWNQLPSDAKLATSLASFKRCLKA